jgi:hypothetical protein
VSALGKESGPLARFEDEVTQQQIGERDVEILGQSAQRPELGPLALAEVAPHRELLLIIVRKHPAEAGGGWRIALGIPVASDTQSFP